VPGCTQKHGSELSRNITHLSNINLYLILLNTVVLGSNEADVRPRARITAWAASDLQTYRPTIAMWTLLFLATSASAQSPPADKDLIENPVFPANCAKCHGKTAEGRHFGGPSLVSEKTAGTSTADLHNIVNNGKGRMPKYASKLTSEEIDVLVQQIKTLNNNR